MQLSSFTHRCDIVVVESTLIVVELNEDRVEVRRVDDRAKSSVGIDTLRRSGYVILLAAARGERSYLVYKGCITRAGPTFDIEVHAVKNRAAEGAGRARPS